MNLSKYKKQLLIIIFISSILTFYYTVNRNSKLERFWAQKSKFVYDILNYTKIIVKIILAINIKIVIFGVVRDNI